WVGGDGARDDEVGAGDELGLPWIQVHDTSRDTEGDERGEDGDHDACPDCPRSRQHDFIDSDRRVKPLTTVSTSALAVVGVLTTDRRWPDPGEAPESGQ